MKSEKRTVSYRRWNLSDHFCSGQILIDRFNLATWFLNEPYRSVSIHMLENLLRYEPIMIYIFLR